MVLKDDNGRRDRSLYFCVRKDKRENLPKLFKPGRDFKHLVFVCITDHEEVF